MNKETILYCGILLLFGISLFSHSIIAPTNILLIGAFYFTFKIFENTKK